MPEEQGPWLKYGGDKQQDKPAPKYVFSPLFGSRGINYDEASRAALNVGGQALAGGTVGNIPGAIAGAVSGLLTPLQSSDPATAAAIASSLVPGGNLAKAAAAGGGAGLAEILESGDPAKAVVGGGLYGGTQALAGGLSTLPFGLAEIIKARQGKDVISKAATVQMQSMFAKNLPTAMKTGDESLPLLMTKSVKFTSGTGTGDILTSIRQKLINPALKGDQINYGKLVDQVSKNTDFVQSLPAPWRTAVLSIKDMAAESALHGAGAKNLTSGMGLHTYIFAHPTQGTATLGVSSNIMRLVGLLAQNHKFIEQAALHGDVPSQAALQLFQPGGQMIGRLMAAQAPMSGEQESSSPFPPK